MTKFNDVINTQMEDCIYSYRTNAGHDYKVDSGETMKKCSILYAFESFWECGPKFLFHEIQMSDSPHWSSFVHTQISILPSELLCHRPLTLE